MVPHVIHIYLPWHHMTLMCLITNKFKRVQHLERRKHSLNIVKKIKPLKNKLIMRVWTPKWKIWSSPHAKCNVHSFEKNHESINYMGLNLNTSWALKKAKANKINLEQKESSKFEWECNIK
jgi:hypothetical protein